MSKNLLCFVSHIDDFEISCLGYIFKHKHDYDKIYCIIATTWEAKKNIWQQNLELIEKEAKIKILYINLEFEQRKLQTSFDEAKDKFYKAIDFNKSSRFDILTHDSNDCHTDHVATHAIAKGLYKYADRFTTIYSPSLANFNANYWIGLTDEQYDLKKSLLDKYDINVEQSYTKLGYYLQSNQHYDIGSIYYIESFVHSDHKHHECYKILKWS